MTFNLILFATSKESEPCLLGIVTVRLSDKFKDPVEKLINEWRENRRLNYEDAEDLTNLVQFLILKGIPAEETDYGSIYL